MFYKKSKLVLLFVLLIILVGLLSTFLCGCGTRIACVFGQHTKDNGTVIKEATCTEEGIKIYYCSVCGKELEDECEVLNMLPHSYIAEENYWQISGYKAPDETHAAMIPCNCSECGQDFVAEYNETEFSATENKVRMEDRYNTLTPLVFDSENHYLIINLAGAENALSELSINGLYDSTSKILTLPVNYNAVALDKVKVVGFKTPTNSFAISTEVGNSLSIIFQNLSYTAPQETDGLNLSNLNNATVEIAGLVSITGASGKCGISARNLIVAGTGSLTLKGGDGINSTNGHGTDGGIGIKANQLTLSLDGTVSITGGHGGVAYNRPAGDNGGDGYDGRDGYHGGNGGSGISADTVKMICGFYSITGGNGGCGGDGSECNRKESIFDGNDNVVGGRGGDGGNGANAIQVSKIDVTGGTTIVTGGSGGNSGRAGGCHDGDKYDKNIWGTWTATNGSAGNAGTGGLGISGTIEGDKTLITQTKGSDGTRNTNLNQNG